MSHYTHWTTWNDIAILIPSSDAHRVCILDSKDTHGIQSKITSGTHKSCIKTYNSGFKLECLESVYKEQKVRCKVYKTTENLSFIIDLQAELFIELLRQSTFINGVCKEPDLSFMRSKTNLGMIHPKMLGYNELLNTINIKNASKTSKRIPGYEYMTTKTSTVYIGTIHILNTEENKNGVYVSKEYGICIPTSRLKGVNSLSSLLNKDIQRIKNDLMQELQSKNKNTSIRYLLNGSLVCNASDVYKSPRVQGDKIIDIDIDLEIAITSYVNKIQEILVKSELVNSINIEYNIDNILARTKPFTSKELSSLENNILDKIIKHKPKMDTVFN